MARYILVAVEDNDKANALHTKLDSWVGFEVVGVFFKPTKFCDCDNYHGRSPRERKFGINIHKECRRPRPGNGQLPANLLYPDIPSQFQHTFINVIEPPETPIERYTQKVIDIKKRQIAESDRKYGQKRRRTRARR